MDIISAWKGQRSPYTHFAHSIPDRPRNILQRARYQIVPGGHGVPVAQVELDVARAVPGCSNPDMVLALVIDRSAGRPKRRPPSRRLRAWPGSHVRPRWLVSTTT